MSATDKACAMTRRGAFFPLQPPLVLGSWSCFCARYALPGADYCVLWNQDKHEEILQPYIDAGGATDVRGM
eukprot:3390614-Rhodomonas_salina.4